MNKILLIVIMVIFSTSMVAIETNGYLSVKSADGVEILVDGKLAGVVKNGQLILELAAGNYEVTAQEYGFTSETIRNVKIEPLKATTLEIHLKDKVVSDQLSGKLQVDLIRKYEKYGTVRVFSIPFSGAQVTINGESYGETDIELSYFPAGQLSIEVEGSNGSKVTGVFLLEENSTLILLADFVDKKIYQLYEVSFDFPASVEMMIDNTKIARNIPSTFIGGTYSVELIAKNSLHFEEITGREIVISKSGHYYLEPDDKPVQEKMVLVEKGSFTMGDTWGDGDDNEKPTHKVTFTYDFYISKYETTFDEYDAFCRATGRSKPNDWGWGRGNRPVINVSWNDAKAYCNWLSEKEDLPKAYDSNGILLDKDGRVTTDPSKVVGYRLPTEAEWEYTARGGNKSKGYKYSGSDNVGDVAWYWENSGRKTQEVGKKVLNELGLNDMSGNVYEWCSDWYGNYPSSAQTNPYNSTAGSGRVVRGGSRDDNAAGVRVANRDDNSPTYADDDLGFRICRTVPYEGENRSPLTPYNPSPSNRSTVGVTSVTLRWDSYDPDDDTMTYDVYFDTNSNPTTKVSSNRVENTLNRSNLSYGTTYYWKVVAKDSKGATTEGPVLKFSIQEQEILVEKGSFTMGDTWGDGYDEEKPTHKVTFTYDFYMNKYELTFGEYDYFCEATGRSKPDDEGWGRGDRPVIYVSWNDAIAYCNWLSEKEKLPKAYDNNGNLLDKDGRITTDPSKVVGYRLPTEAEWEYAARGGNKSNGYKYSGSNNVDDVAWYWRNSGDKYLTGEWNWGTIWDTIENNNCKTQEVGRKLPNKLGIYDMSGNVWELCSDWDGSYSSSAQTNPYNSTAGSGRVARGGSWISDATYARVANRIDSSPTFTYNDLGFRICRTVPYEGENRPPLAPYNPSPSDESIIVGVTSVTLRWDSYDPDGDAVTYDVYFDTNANPTTKVASNQVENTFNRSNLLYDTTYYWKVVAKDSKGATTEGPVWVGIQELKILVEKGSFTMGDTWGDGYDEEKPTHKVTFTYDFYMNKYELTFGEYDYFCEATGRSKPDDEGWGRGDRPVIYVSWNDAIAYCNWLSEKEKLPKAYDNNGNLLDKDGRITTDPSKVVGYRLPTEAEWEYAARGGNKSNGYKYSGSNNVNDVAWYKDNSGDKTQEVGNKAPNELGLYDMSGNILEWCSDWYGGYSSSAQTNPYNSTTSSVRVIRGGSWSSNGADLRVAFRDFFAPAFTYFRLGFRISRIVLFEGVNETSSVTLLSPQNNAIVDSSGVTLNWEVQGPQNNILRTELFFGEAGNLSPIIIGPNSRSYTTGRLGGGKLYEWYVQLTDVSGNTSRSEIRRFEVPSEVTNNPPVITLASPQDGAVVDQSSVELRWSASDADGDRLCFSLYFGKNNDLLLVSESITSNSFTVTNLEPGNSYGWYVRVSDGRIMLDSPLRRFTTAQRVVTIDTPSPSNGSEGVGIKPVLSWRMQGGTGGEFRIYLGTSRSFLPMVGTSTSNTFAYTGELEMETTYFWRVELWEGGNLVSSSPLWQFSTESRPVQVSDSSTVAVYVNGTLNVISMNNTSGTVSVIRNPYQYQGKVSPVTNGDLIYMVDDTGRLVTLRVSGNTIETVSSLNTGTSPETLVLAGDYLWLLDTKSAAVVLRISLDNRGIPTRSESVFRGWTTPVDMFVSEDLSRIHLADAFSGIKVLERSGSSYVDVSSRFTVSLTGYARSVVAVQNLVFSGESGVDGGLKVIDLSRSVRSNLGEYYIVLKLLVSNNIVYAITDKGVSIIDISSPSQPVILRDIEISQVDEIRVSGRLLAVRAGDRLLIYDVLSAGNPVLLSVPEFTTNSSHKVVSITYALFSSEIEEVKLVAGTHEIISSGQRAELEVDWPLDFDTVSIWTVTEESVEFIGAARVTASSSSRNIPVVSEGGETKGSVRIELE